MKPDIIFFLKKVCKKYNLKALFIPDVQKNGMCNDIWTITTPQGMALMTFTTEIFYHMPKRMRERMIEPTLKRGLNQLMGERSIQKSGQLYQHRRMGKTIV